jgi:hypothetical protein
MYLDFLISFRESVQSWCDTIKETSPIKKKRKIFDQPQIHEIITDAKGIPNTS